jgi:HrpA-like RNA helicase
VSRCAQAEDIAGFDFIDPPSSERITGALETLKALGALDEAKRLTNMGRMMAEFPLGPQVRSLIFQYVTMHDDLYSFPKL